MAFEFYPERSGALDPEAVPVLERQPGTFEGIGKAAVQAPVRAALKAAEQVHILATGNEPGLTTEERDAQFKRIEETYDPYIKSFSPQPYETGAAGHLVGDFLEVMSLLATRGGGKAVVASPALNTSMDFIRQGVDAQTSLGAFVGTGTANALGFSVPFLGKTLTSKVLSGIGTNVALGAGTDAWLGQVLNAGGYGDLAKQFDPFNAQARLLDAMIGGAFGGLAHTLQSGARLPPDVADAVLALNRARQAIEDASPGRPLDAGAQSAHIKALDQATRQASEGIATDVAAIMARHAFDADQARATNREAIAKAADDARARALGSGYLPGDIPRAEKLPRGEREVESRFATFLVDNFHKAVRQYDEIPETAGGRIINTDEARKLSTDYAASRDSAATLSRAVHEPASWFTKRLYELKLKQAPKPGQENLVLFSAGGAGAGKTSAIGKADDGIIHRAQIIYDTNANGFESTVNKVDQARSAGKEVSFQYVARDPVDAFVNGVLTRAMNPKNNGRTVPIKEVVATHQGAAETFPRLVEHYANDPGVTFRVIDNTHGLGNARIGNLETIANLNFADLQRRLYAALEKAYQEGRISLATYNGTKGLDTRGRGPAAQRVDRAPEQKQQAVGGKDTREDLKPIVAVPDFPDMAKALEGSKATAIGNVTTVTTERGTRIGVRYALIEADQLRTSHDDTLKPAANFDPALQPRDRERASSEAQVARIEGNLDFNRVADNPTAADGAPIIGADDQVESGNARSIAIRRAYNSGKANAYRMALTDRAPDLGLDPQTVAGMRQPVLVRQRISSVPDRAAFAIESNEQPQARMSLTEQARGDASRMSNLEGLVMNDDGSINMRESAGFVRRFVGNVGPSDINALMRPDGSLSTEGVARIRNAIFAKAYGDPELVGMLLEGTDQNVRNVLTGLSRAAGEMADIREGAREGYYQPLDISSDVAAAARLYAEIKGSGSSIDDYLAHQVLFDPIPQLQQELLKAFDMHARSARRIGDVLGRYADLVRSQGSQAQAGLLDMPDTGMSRESMLAEAAKEIKPDHTRATPSGSEKPLADAVKPEQETVEGKQAAAVVSSNPDVMVAVDDGEVMHGADALMAAEAELEEATRIAALFDTVSADITPATLNAAEFDAPYLEERKQRFNPDQITLDFDAPAPATPAQAVQASKDAVAKLARQPNELARAIAKDFEQKESSVIVGQKIKSLEDVAVVAQVFRNPQFETLRYIFVKRGKVVHATGVSSRMVSSTNAFTVNGEGMNSPGSVSAMLDSTKADSLYMVHNHPSGSAVPSGADEYLTKELAKLVGPRFKGHVVVDHNKYATIDQNGYSELHDISNKDLRTRPIDHPILDRKIAGPVDVTMAAMGIRDLVKSNSFVLLGRDASSKVTSAVEIPLEYLERTPLRLLAELRRFRLNSGANDIFLVGDRLDQHKVIMRAFDTRAVRDVVDWAGSGSLAKQSNGLPGFSEGVERTGKRTDSTQGVTVEEDTSASYDAGKPTPGDDLTPNQVERMRGMVREQLRYLQSQKLRGVDPALNKMSDQELGREASRRAAMELIGEATEKKRRVALATVAADRNAQIQDQHPEGRMRGLVSMMVRDKADKASSQSFESREMATRGWALARLMPALEATNPKLFGLVEDRQGWREIVREIYGEDTGNAAAKAGAKAWLEVAEDMRQQANFAGFKIGKLETYALPQSHNRQAVAAAGADTWIAGILPKLDRDRYVHENGRLFTDRDMEDLLSHAFENIVTNGMNSLVPGQFPGKGARINRGQEHRVLHFLHADDYVDYMSKFGGAGSIHEVITGHVTRMARDIALVETFGPNPDQAFRVMRDRALQSGDKDTLNFTENLYHEISGATSPYEVPTWAEWSQGARNLLVSTKLGGAAVSSITDNATLHITAQLNNLSSMQLFRNQLAAFNPLTKADRDIARANGLGLDVFTQSLNRWGEEGLGSDITGKLAAGTLRASGLTALTEANKRAFGITMMGGIGRLVRTGDFGSLAQSDNRILASKGINETDWQVWRKAGLEDWGNGNDSILSPQAIARIPDAALVGIAPEVPRQVLRNQAIAKLLGAVLEETDNAVVTTGYRERAILRQGTARGTVAGELARHLTLFKSFPTAMISKHWTRALSQPTIKGKVLYASTLFGSLTVLGAVAMSIKDVANGKDPRSFQDPRSWLAAMAQGGGLGIYGDYLFSDQSRFGNSLTASVAGPTAGTLEDVYNLTVGNVHQAIRGEDTHLGAEAIRFAKGNTPLVNLWYTKAALDRFILNDLQEMVSPGYLGRVRSQQRASTGQENWWEPGTMLPERGPDLEALTAEP